MKKVTIYTDGACSGNPGVGGWAAVLNYRGKSKEICGAEKETTNNRMEMLAVVMALRALKEPCDCEIYSDSAYVVNAINQGWLQNWQANGWRNSVGAVKNVDLWQALIVEMQKQHSVVFVKVKGHANVELNERCDELAKGAIKQLTNEEF